MLQKTTKPIHIHCPNKPIQIHCTDALNLKFAYKHVLALQYNLALKELASLLDGLQMLVAAHSQYTRLCGRPNLNSQGRCHSRQHLRRQPSPQTH